MSSAVISDTSCLIALSKINHLELLYAVFNNVIVTEKVKQEFGEELPTWVRTVQVEKSPLLNLLEHELDAGEASAIAYAVENMDALLLIDERKGRIVARRLGLKFVGTLAVLLKAKKMGHLKSVYPSIMEMKNNGFRISKKLVREVLKQADELENHSSK